MRAIRSLLLAIFLCMGGIFISSSYPAEINQKKEGGNMIGQEKARDRMLIESFVNMSDLVAFGEVKRIESEDSNISYILVWIDEVFKGHTAPGINIEFKHDSMEESSMKNLPFKVGDKGILFLTTNNKNVYSLVDKKGGFLTLSGNKLCIQGNDVSFDEYVNTLKGIITSSPKSDIERKQEHAIEMAREKATELGYDVGGMMADIDEHNFGWKRYSSNLYIEHNQKVENILDKKEYWAIYFGPRKLNTLDGDLWVLVDKKTYEILLTIPEFRGTKNTQNVSKSKKPL